MGFSLLLAACTSPSRPAPEVTFWSDAGRIESQRIGEPFVVRFTGGPPGGQVTLRSRFRGYEGWATYRADGDGAVDVGRDPALEGTYTGVDPHGLVWSLRPPSPPPEPTMTPPEPPMSPPEPLDLHLQAEIGGVTVAQATLVRQALDHGLDRRRVDEPGLVGELYTLDRERPRPGVLVLGGSEGGLSLSSQRAAHLATRGFAALALAYFQAEGLPPTLAEIPLEYFAQALRWFARQPEVEAGRIAVLGISRGGELALLLGATFPDLRAVVAEVPSPVRWSGFDRAGKAAWTHEGVALPYLVYGQNAQGQPPPPEMLPGGVPGYRLSWGFEQAFLHAPPDTLAAATITSERTEGPILLIGAGDDGLWPSCRFVDAAQARLRATGHTDRHPDDAVCYPDAGHLIGPPGHPTTDIYASPAPGLGAFIYGGQPAAHARAQRESQTRIEAFLEMALR
jgi:dienelactone hydrolase